MATMLPPTMKAISIAKTGGVEVLECNDVPIPQISDTEILVRNTYSGINFIDTYFRSGQYPLLSLPCRLGVEAAGEVVQVGARASPKLTIGTKVVFLGGGTYAQYASVDAAKAIVIPDGISMDTAVAVYAQGLTALTCIRLTARTQQGQWTLVHAAAGGVGSLLVQMLKLVGAKVIGVASSPEKLAVVKDLGADYVLEYNDNLVAKVKEITGGHGVDNIFDGVGKSTFDADREMIAVGGDLVMLGNSSGNVDPIDLRATLGPKNIRLTRPVVFGYLSDRASLEKWSAELFELVKTSKLKVLQHGTYDFRSISQAHTDIESRKTVGKLLIKIS